ncbi:MAG: lipoate--protein ligase [Chloroflexota bacterium]
MYFINSDTDDPCFNLALEEYLLKNSTEEFFILSINRTSIISGKHQCVHREVNTKFVTENNVPVLRRITGGGTVFHDAGNLNYCFIRNCESGKQIDFPLHTLPVVYFLKDLGICPYLEGSDIKTEGLKISGNAEHVFRNRVLHHGTLLWNASLDLLRNCIRKDTSAYKTRAVASKPSPVINISERVKSISSVEEFRMAMADHFIKNENALTLNLSQEQKAEILKIAPKYISWEWNYAYGPEYEFSKEFNFRENSIKCNIAVKDGLIVKCSIEGSSLLSKASVKLSGCRHMPQDISHFLMQEFDDFDPYNLF